MAHKALQGADHYHNCNQAPGENGVFEPKQAPLQEDEDEEQDVMVRGMRDGIFAEESSISDDDEDIERAGVPNPASRSAPGAANFARSVLDSNVSPTKSPTEARTNNRKTTRHTRSITRSLPPVRVIYSPALVPAPTRKRRITQDITKDFSTKRQRDSSGQTLTDTVEQDIQHELDEEEEREEDVRTMEEVCKPSTQYQYKRYQQAFLEWCDRKQFKDKYRITRDKYYDYMKELLLPLRMDGSATHVCLLLRRNVANSYKSAMRYLYISQCHADGNTPNIKDVLKNDDIRELTSKYHARLRGAKELSTISNIRSTPAQATLGHILNGDSTAALALRSSLKVLWNKDFKDQMVDNEDKWFTIARARLQLAYDYYRFDRASEVSDIQLCDLYPIRFTISREKDIRFAFGIGIANIHGSQSATAIPAITSMVRQEDVEICPVACLAQYFLVLWSGKWGPPDFDLYDWETSYLMFSEDENSSIHMSDSALRQSRKVVSDILDEIPTTSTRTVNREAVFGTYPVNTQGEDTSADKRARVNTWNPLSLEGSFLLSTQTSEPYRMTSVLAGSDGDQVSVTRERFSPSLELQRQIFPFVEDMFPGNADWIQWIDNIMSGQHESTGRPEEDRPIYFNKYIPAIRIGVLLVYLRKVILQDAVALINSSRPTGVQKGVQDKLLWKAVHPVFRSEAFDAFLTSVQSEKESREESVHEREWDKESKIERMSVAAASIEPTPSKFLDVTQRQSTPPPPPPPLPPGDSGPEKSTLVFPPCELAHRAIPTVEHNNDTQHPDNTESSDNTQHHNNNNNNNNNSNILHHNNSTQQNNNNTQQNNNNNNAEHNNNNNQHNNNTQHHSNNPELSLQIQSIQSTLASMTQFMQTFRDETRAAIGVCVERSKSAEESVGKLHGRITRMERSIQGLWSKLDDYGTNFVEQVMEDMEAQHRRQGEQLRMMRRLVDHQFSTKEIDQQGGDEGVFDEEECDPEAMETDQEEEEEEVVEYMEDEEREEREEEESEELLTSGRRVSSSKGVGESKDTPRSSRSSVARHDKPERLSIKPKNPSESVDVSTGTPRRNSVARQEQYEEAVAEVEDDGGVIEEYAKGTVLDERSSLHERVSDVKDQEVDDGQKVHEDSIPLVVEVIGHEQERREVEVEMEMKDTPSETTPTRKLKQVRVRGPPIPRHHDYDLRGPLSLLADDIAEHYEQIPEEELEAKAPMFVMEQRDAPFIVLWVEWFSAMGDKPSIWSLDKHVPQWRMHQEMRFQQMYYFKKKVVYETLKAIVAAEGRSLGERVTRGQKTIQEAIDRHGSISKFFDALRKPRSIKTE